MKKDEKIFRIGCTSKHYDNIGAILIEMGYSFKTYEINELEKSDKLQDLDILFVNCGSGNPTQHSAANIKRFVEMGGALYTSDWADTWIQAIFPGVIDFHNNGKAQNLVAWVVDPDLKAYLNEHEINLHYDLDGWHGIKRNTRKESPIAVRFYLSGVREGEVHQEPLLISFTYEKGFVIFTTFHNSAQVSELEHKLLEFLVLKPLLHCKNTESITMMHKQQFQPTKEIVGALEVGEDSSLYDFIINVPCNLKFIFNWKGKATSKVFIYDPTGKAIKEEIIEKSPYEIDITYAKTGKWTFKMRILDAPLKKFPFSILVGLREKLQGLHQISNTSESVKQSLSSQLSPTIPIQTQDHIVDFMVLVPFQQSLPSLNLRLGQSIMIGRGNIPSNLPGWNHVSSNHFELRLLGPDQVMIKDLSLNGTSAAHYQDGPYSPQQLQKNTPLTFQFPIIVQVANNIILGLF